MRTEQVRAVLAIAEASSFRAAALRLGMSQSALSGAVARLERELGVQLLIRSREGARLSAVGEAAVRQMRAICAADDDLRATVRAAADGATEVVRIATVTAAVNTLLPECLSAFVDDPAVEVQMRIGGSGDVIDDVVCRRADLGLITCDPADGGPSTADLHVQPLISAGVGVVMSAGHRLAESATLTLADLAGERAVAFRAGFMMERIATRLAADVRVVSEVESTPDAVRLVAAGVGVCLLPEFSVGDQDPVVWRPLGDVADRATLALITLPHVDTSDRVRDLESRIRRSGRRLDRRLDHSAPSANTTVRVAV
ncbi:LysR family transcriptional regulator [Gordonia soli]|uniref:LysR family transcriptional regulator n=1 Tax=Gordonia soli TaxID=320799 RepID=UPI00146143D5|nr:LysR family transcriptional regulator [Gordonia soli]